MHPIVFVEDQLSYFNSKLYSSYYHQRQPRAYSNCWIPRKWFDREYADPLADFMLDAGKEFDRWPRLYKPNYLKNISIEGNEHRSLQAQLSNKLFVETQINNETIFSRRFVVNGNCLSTIHILVDEEAVNISALFRSTNAIDVLPIDMLFLARIFQGFENKCKELQPKGFKGFDDMLVNIQVLFSCLHAYRVQPSLFSGEKA